MDPRHEFLEQEMLNELISTINRYIHEHTDEILEKPKLCKEMQEISACIYNHAKLPVDLDGIFSKRNFLSIDVVSLPLLDDMTLSQALHSVEDVTIVIKQIQSIITQYAKSHLNGATPFTEDVRKILDKYILES